MKTTYDASLLSAAAASGEGDQRRTALTERSQPSIIGLSIGCKLPDHSSETLRLVIINSCLGSCSYAG